MYPISQGATFIVQQKAEGFDGSFYGRARVLLNPNPGEANIVVARRLWGNEGPYQIELVDTGAVQSKTEAELIGFDMTVRLRRDGGGILATGDEVAAVIREYPNGPFLAKAENPSTLMLAQAMTPLGGGIGWGTPPIDAPCYALPQVPNRFDIVFGAGMTGGGLDFENWREDDALLIRSLHLTFMSLPEITRVDGWIFDLDQAGDAWDTVVPVPPPPVLPTLPSGQTRIFMELLTPDRPLLSMPDLKVPLLPFQRLVVRTWPVVPGTLRVGLRREARFPYL